jgi:hypothetical protein
VNKNKKKTAGEFILKAALLGVAFSFILYLCGFGLGFDYFIYALGLILGSFILLVVGVILLACSSRQAKKGESRHLLRCFKDK